MVHHIQTPLSQSALTKAMTKKPLLCLDFDGVCCTSTSVYTRSISIPDPPVYGLWTFLSEAVQHFTVCIYGIRSSSHEGREAMYKWFCYYAPFDWQKEIVQQLMFSVQKLYGGIDLSTRCIPFVGKWPSISNLQEFTPWRESALSHVTRKRRKALVEAEPIESADSLAASLTALNNPISLVGIIPLPKKKRGRKKVDRRIVV